MPKYYPTLKARLLAYRRVTRRGCWEWTGGTDGSGYGKLKLNGKSVIVSRLAAVLWKVIGYNSPNNACHTCDNPLCFNPKHLFPGTQMINVRDAIAKHRRPQNR